MMIAIAGRRVCHTVLCFCLVLISGVSLFAQSSGTGAFTGTVKDSSGSVMPNVTVTATSNDTGQKRSVTTGAGGAYTIPLLLPGTYRVRFEANGFKTVEVPSATVVVSEAETLDRTMELGAQTQVVTVTGQVTGIETATSTIGTDITSQTVSGLPLNTRNYTQILGLAPGSSAPANNASALGKGSQNIAVNGAPATSNNFQMDGASVVNSAGGGNVAEGGSYSAFGIPSPDAIEEFKIQTSLFDAGSGRNAGANVNVITKSGTNQFHGTAFEFFRNTDLNANDFFIKYNNPSAPRAVLNQNQFGGVIGGPIKKDKLFFFLSYQETRQKNGAAGTGFSSGIVLPPVPAGDRSNTAQFTQALGAAVCPANNPSVSRDKTYVPPGSTGAGVQVACDGSNINPIAIKILQLKNPDGTYYVPSSNVPGNYQTNVTYSIPARYTEHQLIGNVDYVINSKNTLSSRYFWGADPTLNPLSFGGSGGGDLGVPDTGTQSEYRNHEAVVKLTSILSSNVVNEARFSLQRNDTTTLPTVPFTNSQLGIADATPGVDILDQIKINQQFSLGSYGPQPDQIFNVTQWEAADQISWTLGKHTLRFGGEIERDTWNWLFASLSQGSLTYQTFPDFLLSLPGCAPLAYQNKTCGPSNPGNTNGTPYSSISSSGNAVVESSPGGLNHHFQVPAGSAFIQDDFKVNQRLTLNLGLRWEYDSLSHDKYGLESNFWTNLASGVVPGTTLATGTLVGFVVPSNYQQPIPAGVFQEDHTIQSENNTPRDDFAPRIGFAFQPTASDKLVVRGGFGSFFDRAPGNNNHAAVQGDPYAVTINQSNANNYFSTIAQPYQTVPLNWRYRWANPATLQGSAVNLTPLDPRLLTPLVYQYNLDIQYEFRPSWMLEVGYVGMTGVHQLYTGRPENEAQLASATNPINGITTNTSGNAAYRVPFLGIPANGFSATGTEGNLKSNDLQATVRKQYSHGLSMQASYTWIRAFTTNITANNNSFTYNDPNNSWAEYGLSTDYHPQRLAVNYSWDLPLGNRPGMEGKLVNGWAVTGVTIVQDGTPLTVTDSKGGAVYGFAGISSAELAPGMTSANIASSGSTTSRVLAGLSATGGWYNAAAFTTAPVIGVVNGVGGATGYGNSGISSVLGPGQFNWDISLIKTTKVGGLREDGTLVFRSEFFDAFNHPQFNNPAGSDFSTQGSFGHITSLSVNPRLIQFALKYSF